MINKYLLNECSTIDSLFIWENETTVLWKRHSACSVWSQRTDQEVQNSVREALFFQFRLPKDRFTDLWSEVSTSRNGKITEDAERWVFLSSEARPPQFKVRLSHLLSGRFLGQITKSGCARLCVYKVGMLSLMLRCSYFNVSKSGCLSQSLSARWQQWHSCLPVLGILGMSCVQR